eukprot:4596922-Pyramimonas_sp.AAC.1
MAWTVIADQMLLPGAEINPETTRSVQLAHARVLLDWGRGFDAPAPRHAWEKEESKCGGIVVYVYW